MRRRDYLKTAGVGAAGLLTAGCLQSGSTEPLTIATYDSFFGDEGTRIEFRVAAVEHDEPRPPDLRGRRNGRGDRRGIVRPLLGHEHVDGEVLDVFVKDPDVGTQDPIDPDRTGAAGDDEEVADRLKELGYME